MIKADYERRGREALAIMEKKRFRVALLRMLVYALSAGIVIIGAALIFSEGR